MFWFFYPLVKTSMWWENDYQAFILSVRPFSKEINPASADRSCSHGQQSETVIVVCSCQRERLHECEAVLIKGYKCGWLSGLRSRFLWRGNLSQYASVPLISVRALGRSFRSGVEPAGVTEQRWKSAWAYRKKSSINERLRGDSAAAHCTVTAWKMCISLSDRTLPTGNWWNISMKFSICEWCQRRVQARELDCVYWL